MNKIFIALVVILVMVVGAVFLNSDSEPKNIVTGGVSEDGVKVFILTGENFKFISEGIENPKIVVQEGDRVRIEFSSTRGFHDWVVDEFNASTEKVRDVDQGTFVEFVADKKGTFEYYCSVGEHRENGMKGNFIVE